MQDDPTTLPSQNPEGLLALVADIRGQYGDPRSPIYAGRPDRVAASEQEIAALLVRAGVTEPVVTPATIAQADFEKQWSVPTDPAFDKMIEDRLASIEAQGPKAIAEATATLRAQLGPAQFDTLVEQAKCAGTPLTPAMLADGAILRIKAAEGKFAVAKAKARF